MPRRTASTAKPLSLAERKASLAKIAEGAPAKVRRGIALIELREEATPRQREIAEGLGRKLARKAA